MELLTSNARSCNSIGNMQPTACDRFGIVPSNANVMYFLPVRLVREESDHIVLELIKVIRSRQSVNLIILS